jgi:hypothetical protein
MPTTTALLLLAAIACFVFIFYVLLPKLNLDIQTGKWIRAVLFFAIMGYLAYDFYTKEKYMYIAFLVAGSIAFVLLLKAKKSTE